MTTGVGSTKSSNRSTVQSSSSSFGRQSGVNSMASLHSSVRMASRGGRGEHVDGHRRSHEEVEASGKVKSSYSSSRYSHAPSHNSSGDGNRRAKSANRSTEGSSSKMGKAFSSTFNSVFDSESMYSRSDAADHYYDDMYGTSSRYKSQSKHISIPYAASSKISAVPHKGSANSSFLKGTVSSRMKQVDVDQITRLKPVENFSQNNSAGSPPRQKQSPQKNSQQQRTKKSAVHGDVSKQLKETQRALLTLTENTQSVLRELRSEKSSLEEETFRLRDSLRGVTLEKGALLTELRKAKQTINDLKTSSIDLSRKQVDIRLESKERLLEVVSAERDELHNKVLEQEQKIIELTGSKLELTEKVKQLESELIHHGRASLRDTFNTSVDSDDHGVFSSNFAALKSLRSQNETIHHLAEQKQNMLGQISELKTALFDSAFEKTVVVDQLESLASEVSKFDSWVVKLRELTDEKTNLRKQLDELLKAQSETKETSRVNEMNKLNVALREDCKNKKTEIAAQRRVVSNLEEELSFTRQELLSMKEAFEVRDRELQALKFKMGNTDDHGTLVEQLKDAKSRLERQHKDEVIRSEEERKKIANELTFTTEKLLTESKRRKESEDMVSSLKHKVAELELNAFDQVKQENMKAEKEVMALTKKYRDQIEEQRHSYRSLKSEYDICVDDLRKIQREHNEERALEKGKLSAKEKHIGELNSKAIRLEGENYDLKNETDRLRAEVESLAMQVSKREQENELLVESKKDYKVRVQELAEQNSELSYELANCKKDLSTVSVELRSLEQKARVLQSEKNMMVEKLKTAESLAERYRSESEELGGKLQKAREDNEFALQALNHEKKCASLIKEEAKEQSQINQFLKLQKEVSDFGANTSINSNLSFDVAPLLEHANVSNASGAVKPLADALDRLYEEKTSLIEKMHSELAKYRDDDADVGSTDVNSETHDTPKLLNKIIGEKNFQLSKANDEIGLLKDEMDSVKSEIESLKSENSNLKNEINSLKQSESKDQYLPTGSPERSKKRKRGDSVFTEVTFHDSEAVAASKKVIRDLMETYSTLSEQYHVTGENPSVNPVILKELEEEIDKLKKHLIDQIEREQSVASVNSSIFNTSGDASKMSEVLKEKQEKIERLEKACTILANNNEELSEKLSGFISALNTRDNSHSFPVANIENVLITERISQLNEDIDFYKDRYETQAKELASLQSEVLKIKELNEDILNENKSLKESLSSASALKHEKEEAEREIHLLEDSHRLESETMMLIVKKNEELEKEISELKLLLQDAKEELVTEPSDSSKPAEVFALSEADLRAEIQTLKRELAIAQETMEQEATNYMFTLSENARLKEEVEAFESTEQRSNSNPSEKDEKIRKLQAEVDAFQHDAVLNQEIREREGMDFMSVFNENIKLKEELEKLRGSTASGVPGFPGQKAAEPESIESLQRNLRVQQEIAEQEATNYAFTLEENAALKAHVEELSNEAKRYSESLSAEKEAMRKENGHLLEDFRVLKEENKSLIEQVRSSEHQYDLSLTTLQSELSDLKTKNTDLVEEIDKLQQNERVNAVNMYGLENQLQELQLIKQEMEVTSSRKLGELNGEIDRLRQSLDEGSDVVVEQLTAENLTLKNLIQDYSKGEEDKRLLESVQASNMEYANAIQQWMDENSRLREVLLQYEKNMDSLTQEVNSLNDVKKALEGQPREVTDSSKQKENDGISVKKELEERQEKISFLEAENERLSNEVNNLTHNVEVLQEDYSRAIMPNPGVTELTNQLNTIREENSVLRHELDRLNKQISLTQLHSESEDKSIIINTLREENAILKSQIENGLAREDKSTSFDDTFTNQIRVDNANLQTMLEAVREELESVKAKYEQLANDPERISLDQYLEVVKAKEELEAKLDTFERERQELEREREKLLDENMSLRGVNAELTESVKLLEGRASELSENYELIATENSKLKEMVSASASSPVEAEGTKGVNSRLRELETRLQIASEANYVGGNSLDTIIQRLNEIENGVKTKEIEEVHKLRVAQERTYRLEEEIQNLLEQHGLFEYSENTNDDTVQQDLEEGNLYSSFKKSETAEDSNNTNNGRAIISRLKREISVLKTALDAKPSEEAIVEKDTELEKQLKEAVKAKKKLSKTLKMKKRQSDAARIKLGATLKELRQWKQELFLYQKQNRNSVVENITVEPLKKAVELPLTPGSKINPHEAHMSPFVNS